MSVPIWINGIAYLPAVECETRVNILEAALREMKKHLRGEVYDTIVLGELIDNALPQTETTAALKPCWCNAGCMLKIRGDLPASRYCKQARSAQETKDE